MRGQYSRRSIGSLVVILVVLTAVPLTAFGQIELTIDEAVELGLQNDETYLIAKEELDRAAGQIREAWAGALPRLDFQGMYTRNIEIPEVVIAGQSIKFGTKNNYSLGLTLTQPLYLAGKVSGALKIAKYYRSYAEYKLQQAENDVIYEIKRAFFGAKLAADMVEVYENAIKQAELNLENVQKQFDLGMAAEYDVLRAEVELANLKPLLIKSRNDSGIALIVLLNRLNVPGDQEVILKYEFNPADLYDQVNLQTGMFHARNSNPVILQQDYLVKSYDKAIGIRRADRLPQLYFMSSYDYSGQSDEFRPPSSAWTDSWSASLILSFPIFEGRAISGRVMQAKADYNQSRYLARQVRENVLLSVKAAYGSWQEAVASLKTQEKTVEQAEEGLRIANLRYNSGVGTQLEVLSAQTANTQAKVNHINAVYDYELAVAEYQRAVGLKQDYEGESDE